MATKKINKVDTPVDQRETFVSLQKTFAESENIEEVLRTLYELQKTDSEIDKVEQLQGELPQEVLALKEELAALKAKTKELAAEAEGYQELITRNRQGKIESEAIIAKCKAQLDNISNSREFDTIQKEIENAELEVKIADKHIGEAKIEMAKKRQQIEDVKDHISIVESDLKAKESELSEIRKSNNDVTRRLADRRAQCAAKVDEKTISAYERIRASVKNRLAVVTVFKGACGGCFNAITPQRLIDIDSNKKPIICENCGRIIVSNVLAGIGQETKE